ncbi:MAG: hypothetical protein HC910_07010 [Spirulinaceae cyanobacterium SM2_1_0]|nr:hypothetical protein [Spirulinaceae cyanobacterium SM2_1_0]
MSKLLTYGWSELFESPHGLRRISDTEILSRLGRKHPELRSLCVQICQAQLANGRSENPEFNGFLVSTLLDLSATEAAETIMLVAGCLYSSSATGRMSLRSWVCRCRRRQNVSVVLSAIAKRRPTSNRS